MGTNMSTIENITPASNISKFNAIFKVIISSATPFDFGCPELQG